MRSSSTRRSQTPTTSTGSDTPSRPDVPRPARRHGLITAGGAVAVGLVDRLALLLAMLAGMCVLVGPPVSEHSLERAAVVTASVDTQIRPLVDT